MRAISLRTYGEHDTHFSMTRKRRVSTKPGHRFCNRCERELPATLEVFLKDSTRPLGLAYECRECHSARKRGRDRRTERWANHTPAQREKVVARNRTYNRTDKGRAVYLAFAYHRVDRGKGHECDMDRHFILNEIIPKPCHYCGTIEHPRGCDRIDNSIGHLKSNVVPSCAICNLARGDRLTHEEMMILGRVIAKILADRPSSSVPSAGHP